jgi:hypothetical protein
MRDNRRHESHAEFGLLLEIVRKRSAVGAELLALVEGIFFVRRERHSSPIVDVLLGLGTYEERGSREPLNCSLRRLV